MHHRPCLPDKLMHFVDEQDHLAFSRTSEDGLGVSNRTILCAGNKRAHIQRQEVVGSACAHHR